MATQAALLIALVTVLVLVATAAIKRMVRRRLMQSRGEQTARRAAEAGRLIGVSLAAALVVGSVLVLGPEAIAADVVAGRQ